MSNIEVIEKIGNNPGKTVVILAGVHGNENCGVEAFNFLISNLKIDSGKVYFIYANKAAIRENKRFIDFNLNRCFLQSQMFDMRNSLEGKTAREIIPYLDEADAMLDIHASYTKESIPFVICDKKWIREAKMFDSEVVSYNWDLFHSGSTDYYMNIRGKVGFCYECGYLGDIKAKERAERAIMQFLAWNQSISREIILKSGQKIIKIVSIYKNSNQPFRKSKNFPDFFKLSQRMIVGKEGEKEIYCENGDILLFVRDCDILNDECFLVAREEEQKINKRLDSDKSKEKQC